MSKSTVFVRTPYNYPRDEVSFNTGLDCPEPTRAQQHFRDECDINEIVRRFGVTGMVDQAKIPPQFGDFTGVSDYHTAANAIAKANETFEMMPADLRDRFQNDPSRFVDFVLDEKNVDELRRLKLLPEVQQVPEPPVQGSAEPVKPQGATVAQ